MARKRSLRERFTNWVKGDEALSTTQGVSESPTSGSGGVKRDPSETLLKRVGLALDVGESREYQAPEFDLDAIAAAYDTEAYARQAIDKYIEMMFKAGWDFVGTNQNAIDYVRARFRLMAEMTGIPTEQLFIEVAEDLVKYSNAILVKARDKQGFLNGSQLGVNVQGLGGEAPVAGYFPLNMTTVSVMRDRVGAVRGWEQEVEGSDRPVRFKGTDVVHFYYKRDKGRAFGTPFLLPVLNDIRSLRQMEATVLELVYQNLHPFRHIKVGSEDIPGRAEEVDAMEAEYSGMEISGSLITTERVKVDSISSDNVLDANNYLKYFEQRVFTGLGVSELMMGRGNTANRSTGDNLSSEFADRVKAFQKVMAIFVDEHMVQEILMEGGFDPTLNVDDDVDFVFKEIDIDAKIKSENHATFLYEHNAITEDEMRAMIGKDPIVDRSGMHMNLVTIPTKGVAGDDSEGSADTNNRNEPQNQHNKDSSSNKEDFDIQLQEECKDALERVFNKSHKKVSEQIDTYIKDGSDMALHDMSVVIRNLEGDLVQTVERYMGSKCSEDSSIRMNRLCKNYHDSIVEVVTSMVGEEKEKRIYETVGGIQEVQALRLQDVVKYLSSSA